MRSGFTLLEVVVALVVFSIGLLGAAGMLTASARTLSAARGLEAAGALALEVADSLASAGVNGPGMREDPRGSVTWTVESRGTLTRVRIVVRATGRASEVVVLALLPSRASSQ